MVLKKKVLFKYVFVHYYGRRKHKKLADKRHCQGKKIKSRNDEVETHKRCFKLKQSVNLKISGMGTSNENLTNKLHFFP